MMAPISSRGQDASFSCYHSSPSSTVIDPSASPCLISPAAQRTSLLASHSTVPSLLLSCCPGHSLSLLGRVPLPHQSLTWKGPWAQLLSPLCLLGAIFIPAWIVSEWVSSTWILPPSIWILGSESQRPAGLSPCMASGYSYAVTFKLWAPHHCILVLGLS